jgi:DNA topoisomerase-1
VGLALTHPIASAKNAGLRYVTDQAPGIRRIGTGKTFRYIGPNGRAIHDREILWRIRSLAIPPAWTDVWICKDANGHLQAVGRDARKRKQYRYHPRWREVRDETKFDRMAAFGRVLPRIRARVRRDLVKSGFPREKVLATIVKLLEMTLIRVGNEEYTRHNQSFGLTTLRNRHVNISGGKVHFYFRGKSGVKHAISVEDRHLAKIVRRLLDLPGYELFQYIDDDGDRRSIGSTDVNDYLREITSEDFTTKDFRTWAGTVLALEALCKCPSFTSQRQAKKNIVKSVEKVAERLGNTAAVCKKCYIHPGVFEAYMAGSTLSPGEKALEAFLRKWSRRRPKPTLEQALTKSVRRLDRRKK